MNKIEKYDKVFIESFQVRNDVLASLVYQGVDLWDSVGHMKMIAQLEEAFDIMFETDDILDFSSYNKGLVILEKYGVKL
jgi:acyl carrier protein